MPWLKIGYFEGRESAADWESLEGIADSPGRHSGQWGGRHLPEEREVRPPFAPDYQLGEQVLIYVSGRRRCPALVEVTDHPRWDPAGVDARQQAAEGDRWGMWTPVRLVKAVDLDDAPELRSLGVPLSGVARRGRRRIDDWVLEGARSRLGLPALPARQATSSIVELEASVAHTFDRRAPTAGRTGERREQRLVLELAAFLRGLGHEVGRNRIADVAEDGDLLSDLYDRTSRTLVEAKASTRRADVRMAIGQLADYARHVRPRARHRAVLVPALPHPDLRDLLRSCDVAIIWPEAGGFRSTLPELVGS